jgi:hypothetical protein
MFGEFTYLSPRLRRPHPAVTRNLKFAAEQAASRNSHQDDSAASFLSRWRHKIQIANLSRRAAMYRAMLPKLSTLAHWLLSGAADCAEETRGREEVLFEDDEE